MKVVLLDHAAVEEKEKIDQSDKENEEEAVQGGGENGEDKENEDSSLRRKGRNFLGLSLLPVFDMITMKMKMRRIRRRGGTFSGSLPLSLCQFSIACGTSLGKWAGLCHGEPMKCDPIK